MPHPSLESRKRCPVGCKWRSGTRSQVSGLYIKTLTTVRPLLLWARVELRHNLNNGTRSCSNSCAPTVFFCAIDSIRAGVMVRLSVCVEKVKVHDWQIAAYPSRCEREGTTHTPNLTLIILSPWIFKLRI